MEATRRRREWFARHVEARVVLRWVPAGARPTAGEALERPGGAAGARAVTARGHLRLPVHRGRGGRAPAGRRLGGAPPHRPRLAPGAARGRSGVAANASDGRGGAAGRRTPARPGARHRRRVGVRTPPGARPPASTASRPASDAPRAAVTAGRGAWREGPCRRPGGHC
ncbi:DUF3291 domain-containing protein [Streptomyces fradiae]|uniref:DUF3291 domain-containing protein n=1 Tax=Streptomyces fradiae TaxID=1906 RepID=UPI0037F4C814